MGGAEGATHPRAVNGAFGAVSGLQNFLDFSKIEGLHFLIGNFLIARRTVVVCLIATTSVAACLPRAGRPSHGLLEITLASD